VGVTAERGASRGTVGIAVEQASACLFLTFANSTKVKTKQAKACSTQYWQDGISAARALISNDLEA
jgi:hypothetical protein